MIKTQFCVPLTYGVQDVCKSSVGLINMLSAKFKSQDNESILFTTILQI